MDLQEIIPDDHPRWNFEGYAFSMLPPVQSNVQPCPENSTPVYRAYRDVLAACPGNSPLAPNRRPAGNTGRGFYQKSGFSGSAL
jgi:hypothetical protein